MVKAGRNPTRTRRLLEPIAAVAALYISSNTTSDSFKLQVLATVVALSDEGLQELAQVIVSAADG